MTSVFGTPEVWDGAFGNVWMVSEAVPGPFCVNAGSFYVAGAVRASEYKAGADAVDTLNAGGAVAQGDC